MDEHSKQLGSEHGVAVPFGPGNGCGAIGNEHKVELMRTFGSKHSKQLVELHLMQSVATLVQDVHELLIR